MLKASALYIVIIIALVIALLCSSLIVAAYFYKSAYQKKFRQDQLQNNISSGINILIANADTSYLQEKSFSLFNGDTDSVSLKKIPWGIYDIGVAKAFIQKDTLFKVFSLANTIDSIKWATLYVIDEDRPLSLSGKTMIRGNAWIPKAGVNEVYVNNIGYRGDKRLIIGVKHDSEKKLPELQKDRINLLEHFLPQATNADSTWLKKDSVQNSFLLPTLIAKFGKKIKTVENIKLSGNIILFSDTTLIIDSTSMLKNILVFAKSIIVKSGFKGSCQLFATDSVSISRNCQFDYPSCIGVLRFKTPMISTQVKISLGEKSNFNGTIFTYEKNENPVKPMVDIGKHVIVKGQIYSQGILKYQDTVEVDGSVFTSRFRYQTPFTLFENYLINIRIDSKALSPYYLMGELLPGATKKKKVLQWLESN